jgi:hypothetical protein
LFLPNSPLKFPGRKAYNDSLPKDSFKRETFENANRRKGRKNLIQEISAKKPDPKRFIAREVREIRRPSEEGR